MSYGWCNLSFLIFVPFLLCLYIYMSVLPFTIQWHFFFLLVHTFSCERHDGRWMYNVCMYYLVGKFISNFRISYQRLWILLLFLYVFFFYEIYLSALSLVAVFILPIVHYIMLYRYWLCDLDHWFPTVGRHLSIHNLKKSWIPLIYMFE